MECSNCLIEVNCQLGWKGTAKDDCFIRKTDDEGNPLWGTCPGCGCVRQKEQAENHPCEMCKMISLMSPEQQTVTKEKLTQHEGLVVGTAEGGGS